MKSLLLYTPGTVFVAKHEPHPRVLVSSAFHNNALLASTSTRDVCSAGGRSTLIYLDACTCEECEQEVLGRGTAGGAGESLREHSCLYVDEAGVEYRVYINKHIMEMLMEDSFDPLHKAE
jgi:hypothetical protein